MKKQLVFWTALNSYQSSKLLRGKPEGSRHPVTTEGWTKRRIDLFKKYNLPSILNQNRDDWLYMVLLDPKMKKVTDPLLPKIDERIVYCYEDQEGLEMIYRSEEVILTLIDSDDMYHRDVANILLTEDFEWAYFKYGFALDERRKKLFMYDTIGVGPFFAHRFPSYQLSEFDRDKRHPTHKAVVNFRPKQLEKNRFVVLLHEVNTSSNPRMRYVLKKEVKLRTLGYFGVNI